MKRIIVFSVILALAAGASEVLPVPVPVNPAENCLQNSGFSRVNNCSDKKLRYYRGKNVLVKNGRLPADFQLLTPGQPRHAGGRVALLPLPDQKNKYLSIHTPNNKFDSGTALVSDTVFKLEKEKKEPLYCGVWAKGNGTLIVKILQKKGKTFQDSQVEKLLVVPAWHYYRVRIPEKLRGRGELKLSLSAFGQVDMAFPEIAPLPAVDHAAELLFYVPFEKGRLEAVFSRGPVANFGNPGLAAVRGKFGDAGRFDRKRRLDEMGKLRYQLGFGYDFLGKALDSERGTIEFFFRPLDEMLKKQQWGNIFPLFYLGDTTWQWANSQDFSLQLELLPGNKMKLSCSEYLRKKSWPEEILIPNNTQKTESAFTPDSFSGPRFQRYAVHPYGEYIIRDARAFAGKFHHLAFTYDDKKRTVWLDGKPVIELKALKKPAVSSRVPKLLFANGNINHPGIMSADLDELKIYSGVKYHKNFTPRENPPKLIAIKPEKADDIPMTWQSGKPYLSKDKKSLCFPLTRGKAVYTLEAACADGLPLIFSPKNAALNLRTDYQVEMPLMEFELKNAAPASAELFNRKRGVTLRCELKNRGERCVLKMKIIKGPSRFRAYLEPRVTLRTSRFGWQHAFDGAEKREILLPFYPFEFEDMFMAMPLAAAWNNHRGSALALSPESLCSWMSRGMTSSNALALKVRTVLNDGESIGFDFDVLSISPEYGENDAVDRYHALYPHFFKLDDKADPKTYGNMGLSEVWNNAAYQKRKASFSMMELNRRIGATWCWYYYDGSSTGNFSVDPELLAELAPVNIRHLGDHHYHDTFLKKKIVEWENLKNMGVLPGLYVSSWLDRRFQRYYADSDYESDAAYNGISFWPQYWCRNIIDHVMLPTGTEYGDALRNQMKRMLQNVKSCNSFSYDLCGYNYKFRQPNTLGGLNAFDEHGAFLQNVTALALLLDDIKKMKNHSPYRTSVTGNVDILLSGYPASFRQDNTIHEQQTLVTLQTGQLRRRQTRLQGERPTTFCNMPPLDGNFFGDEDPRLLRYAAVAAHHNRILTGMLYNIRQNYEIFGVKESVESLDDLRRTQGQGYRQTAGAKISGKLEPVRYGSVSRGTLALVNSSPWKQSGTLEIDTAYFRAVPLIAAEGEMLRVDGGKVQLHDIKPLSWCLVEFIASVPGKRELAYTSKLERKADKVTAVFTFTRPADLSKIVVQTMKNETPEMFFNGRKVDRIPEKAAARDTLTLSFRNTMFLADAEKIISFDFVKDGVVTLSAQGKAADIAAARIAEFFRWYGVVTGKKWRVERVPSGGTICVQEHAGVPVGIGISGKSVCISGTALQLSVLTDTFLNALDRRYVWHGVFGVQQPTRDIDWAATGMQRKFQQRHGLSGKAVSVQKIAEDFAAFLKEKNIDTTQGF